jgi:hypothetical protein
VVDNLEVFRAAVVARIAKLRSVVSELRQGRGAHLGSLVLHTLERFDSEVSAIDFEVAEAAAVAQPEQDELLQNSSRKYERLSPQLDIVYSVLAKYRDAVNRADVPVGMQHLVGILISEILVSPGDPLINLSPENTYSTIDLVEQLDYVLRQQRGVPVKIGYDFPHPIAFNMPALDPSNALLSPLVAHEVAHTAVNERLLAELQKASAGKAEAILVAHLASVGQAEGSPTAIQWAGLFQSWCNELLCDAVALALTGPSFAFAFAAYLPPTNFAIVNTHPPLRDRMAFHLSGLTLLGWDDVLDERCPAIQQWMVDASQNLILTNNPAESFLREAMVAIQDDIFSVAFSHVKTQLSPSEVVPLLAESVSGFQVGIPWVEIGAKVLSAWQVILSGWFAAIAERGDNELCLGAASNDDRFNALLVKALEMSSIVQAWRGDGSPTS